MKKILLLCSIILCCLSSYASLGFTQSATSISSGGTLTITGTGEITTINGGSYWNAEQGQSVTSTVPSADLSKITLQYSSVTWFNPSTQKASVLSFKLTNTSAVAVTVTFEVLMDDYNNATLQEDPQTTEYFTVTVQPAPTGPYYNTAVSGYFPKTNCGTGYAGSQVLYTIAANTYSSTVSQPAAQLLATNALSAGGPTYANAGTNGTCSIIYYNVQQNGPWSRNNCAINYTGTSVPETVAAGLYQSTVSQAAADLLAFNAGQAYVNANGACIPPPAIVTFNISSTNGYAYPIQFAISDGSVVIGSGRSVTINSPVQILTLLAPSAPSGQYPYNQIPSSTNSTITLSLTNDSFGNYPINGAYLSLSTGGANVYGVISGGTSGQPLKITFTGVNISSAPESVNLYIQ